MTTSTFEVQGTLREDGTLVLDEKPNLPPGRVRVRLCPAAEVAVENFQRLLHSLRASQQARGHVPRTVEQVEQDRQALRAEMDREVDEAGRLQEENRRLRQQTQGDEGTQP